jgi:hypothetical protein
MAARLALADNLDPMSESERELLRRAETGAAKAALASIMS